MSLEVCSSADLGLRERGLGFPDRPRVITRVLGGEKRNQAPWGNVVKRMVLARILGAAEAGTRRTTLIQTHPGFWAEGQSSINGRRQR